MKCEFNPGVEKKTINLIDNIVYTTVKDLQGNDLELKMSIMLQNGNAEMRIAAGEDDLKEDHSPKPCLVWIPGGGWRGVDKNLMLGEMSEFARAGYVVASVYYRSSAQGHFPAQLEDVRTAIRFLRANAEKYEINPDKIGTMGRSAGGHLAAFTATNIDQYNEGDWQGFSSKVQAAVDMFGPVDVGTNMDSEIPKFADPKFRWHKIEDTHGGALIGGDPATIRERAEAASPVNFVTEAMAPIQIFHGGNDPLVPAEISSDTLYERAVEAGLDEQTEYYFIPHAGHGTREFFQDATKEKMLAFYDKYLKN